MNNFHLDLKNNILKISGYITFENIMDVLNKCILKTNNMTHIIVDLKNLYSSNSSVLLFIINYIRHSMKQKQEIKFINIPELLTELSKVYNLNKIIHRESIKR